ncbi:hypothetical protein AAG906_032421 [Vitis piasezkii]
MKQLKQIHAQMLRTGPFFDPFFSSRLIIAAALSPFPSLDYAQQVFDQIPTQISALGTLSFTLELFTGKAFHGMVIKVLLGSDVFILNSSIHFYAKCGELGLGYRVFVNMPRRNVVSWNSMITTFVQGGCSEKALELFREMKMQNVKPNGIIMVEVLSACAKKSDFEFGRWVHSYIESNKIGESLTLSNAMLDMYTKCGSVEDAKRLFDKMSEKDIVSWTTMLIGYAKIGEYDVAQGIFDAMPNQDIAAWNALISAYEQCAGSNGFRWMDPCVHKEAGNEVKLPSHYLTY